MADKSVGELIAAQSVTPTDLFVLEQNGTAKKLTGQVLENWLVSFADGHGGIHSIKKLSTSGLVDTYRITLADTTTFDFDVTNGRSITGISKTSTSGLVDTYTITYNNGPASTFTVKNGEKGDKGDNTYTWVKYASQEPTESSHSIGDIPDDWIGIYYGNASKAPTDWKQYKWFKHKGEKGDTGSPATLATKSVTYQVGDSGTIIPSGSWGSSIPVVSQGKYLWTKTELRFNTGDPVVSYSVARMGIDGTGSVSSVAGVSPDATGNVTLTAADVGALAVSGGDMTGAIDMNGQPISGLNDPTEDTQAARKGYVDTAKEEANAYTDASVRKAAQRNLLDNSDFRNPVNQRGVSSGALTDWNYFIDRWRCIDDCAYELTDGGIRITGGAIAQTLAEGTKDNGKTYTLAVCLSTGTIRTLTYTIPGTDISEWTIFNNKEYSDVMLEVGGDSSVCNVMIHKMADFTIRCAALYEGEYTAETLPEYQPKGYGVELAECQRYYFDIGRGTTWKYLTNTSLCEHEGYMEMFIPTPVTMRKIPSAFITGTIRVMPSMIDISEIETTSLTSNGITIKVKCTGITSGAFNIIQQNGSGIICLTADL